MILKEQEWEAGDQLHARAEQERTNMGRQMDASSCFGVFVMKGVNIAVECAGITSREGGCSGSRTYGITITGKYAGEMGRGECS